MPQLFSAQFSSNPLKPNIISNLPVLLLRDRKVIRECHCGKLFPCSIRMLISFQSLHLLGDHAFILEGVKNSMKSKTQISAKVNKRAFPFNDFLLLEITIKRCFCWNYVWSLHRFFILNASQRFECLFWKMLTLY